MEGTTLANGTGVPLQILGRRQGERQRILVFSLRKPLPFDERVLIQISLEAFVDYRLLTCVDESFAGVKRLALNSKPGGLVNRPKPPRLESSLEQGRSCCRDISRSNRIS